jgi:hypothetical protein
MQLDDFLAYEVDDDAEQRRLAEEKSYEILDHLESFEHRFAEATGGDSRFGSVSPSIFVGRANYPRVSTGLLSPVGHEEAAGQFETSGEWYEEGVSISEVFRRRTSLLNAAQSVERDVSAAARDSLPAVADAWTGFLGTQREVAIADRPVDVEIDLADGPNVDFSVGRDDISTPTGPRARATTAELGENPHVPPAVEKTLEDDDWRAEGAINYLYNRGFDVYEINTILSAGALGQTDQRRLVPTRWSITAVDDTVGQFLRGSIQTNPSVDSVQVCHDSYLGNEFWVVLAPGQWEYELVEAKAAGSIWNPNATEPWYASDREGQSGRTSYPEETAGAYHAARLGVLEHLADVGRTGKALVVRYVSPDYWGPAGVWQVRESVRHAFEGDHGEAETLADAVAAVADRLPVPLAALRRQSTMVAGLQSTLSAWTADSD